YIICLLYFGAKTRWYLHLHCVCAKLLLSFIGLASFYGEIWWSGNQPYLTMKRGFFYPTLEALWNPRQSQGFSKTIKKLHPMVGMQFKLSDFVLLNRYTAT